jgi:hypothetical protein
VAQVNHKIRKVRGASGLNPQPSQSQRLNRSPSQYPQILEDSCVVLSVKCRALRDK